MVKLGSLRMLLWCVGMLALASISSASGAPINDPRGTWLTANGQGVVEIAQWGDGLCGRIVGIDRAPGEPMPTDVQGRSQSV